MKQTINKYQFQDAFQALRPDNFSYEGLSLLFDYFESLEADTGEEKELDVIDICCDFIEDKHQDIIDNYDIDLTGCEDELEIAERVVEYLQKNTSYIGETEIGLVYQQF